MSYLEFNEPYLLSMVGRTEEITESPEYDFVTTKSNIISFEESFTNASSQIGTELNKTLKCFTPTLKFTYQSYILLVMLPIIILAGTIGNLLSIVVLRRRVMRMTAASFYLVVLTVPDLSVLYFSALKTWIRVAFGFELMHVSNIVCKILKYLFFTSTHLSAWLVVAITIERFLVVCFPLKVHKICSYKHAQIISSVLVIIILSLNTNILWASELITVDKCGVKSCAAYSYSRYLYTVWPKINLTVYSLLPFFLVLCMNLIIIHSIIKNNRSMKGHKHSNSETLRRKNKIDQHLNNQISNSSTNSSSKASDFDKQANGVSKNKDTIKNHITALPMSTMAVHLAQDSPQTGNQVKVSIHSGRHSSNGSNSLGRSVHLNHQRRLTCTLVTISILWLLFTGPFALVDMLDLNNKPTPFIVRLITYLLMYTNHAINFYIYCLTGRKFRYELCAVFSNKKNPNYRQVPLTHQRPNHINDR